MPKSVTKTNGFVKAEEKTSKKEKIPQKYFFLLQHKSLFGNYNAHDWIGLGLMVALNTE